MTDIEDATLALAAGVADRVHDLIQDGWVKGRFYTKTGGAPHRFCILGAIDLALEEFFQKRTCVGSTHVGEIVRAFISDEALTRYGSWGSIPGFNDASERKLEEVLAVVAGAARRLWDLSVQNEDVGAGVDLTRYATEQEEGPARAYLHAVLA